MENIKFYIREFKLGSKELVIKFPNHRLYFSYINNIGKDPTSGFYPKEFNGGVDSMFFDRIIRIGSGSIYKRVANRVLLRAIFSNVPCINTHSLCIYDGYNTYKDTEITDDVSINYLLEKILTMQTELINVSYYKRDRQICLLEMLQNFIKEEIIKIPKD